LYTFIVALTRLYLGAHYPTDIAAGVFIGAMDGFVAIVTINRLGWFLRLAGGARWLKTAYAYVFVTRSPGKWSSDPVPARAMRLALLLGALIGGAFLGGWAVNFTGLRIIHDLMRNFDNSLTQPLLLLFNPQWAETIYQTLGNAQIIYPALGIIVLLAAARRGWRELIRGVLVVALASLLIFFLLKMIGFSFDRPLPYSQLKHNLPQEWLIPWASLAAFPQRHILTVAALTAALAHFARPLLPVAYAYMLAVAAALLYSGAAWPTDILISLLVGQGVAHYAVFLSLNLVPKAAERRSEPCLSAPLQDI
ncbi:MAG: phosphatase PAP2 family protein, partial [Dehalococcoidia bacterium]|nr:phosphatase PAP2 family protein [Dehalococcoidia bacterium]